MAPQSRYLLQHAVADKISTDRRSENMRRIRSQDTSPELAVRRLVHALGYRFRLHRKDLPGKPDLVLPRHRKVIFVHGCFWHQHPRSKCADSRLPKSNTGYWTEKLTRNAQRDTAHLKTLRLQGWGCLIIWDCDLRNPKSVSEKLTRFLEKPNRSALKL